MENSNKNRKKLIVSIIGVMILILFSVGMVYAFFAYSRIGSRNNVLSTADLTFSFEDSNWIWLENAYPMYVDAALTLETNGANKYVANDNDVDAGIAQFKITSGHPSGAIHYLVSLVKEDLTSIATSQNNKFTLDPSTKIEQLPDGAISLNLQTSTSDIFDTTGLVNDLNNLSFPGRSFEPSVSNSNYINDVGEIKVSELPNGTETNEKVLGSGIMSGDIASRYFELRMWINDRVVINDELRSRCLSSTSQTDVNTYGRGYCNPSTEGMDEEITYVYSSGEFEKLYYSNRVKVQTTEVTNGVIDSTTPILKKLKAQETEIRSDTSFANLYSNVSSSSDTGLFKLESTANDPYPIYFYRGNVQNNHLIFAGFCWKIVRTTETGGTKIIYDGEPNNGVCNNIRESTEYSKTVFNKPYKSPAHVGYKFGTSHQQFYYGSELYFTGNIVFGKDITYNSITGEYTLLDTITLEGPDYNSYINDTSLDGLKYHHYSCGNSSDSCTEVYYYYYIATNVGWNCFVLRGGQTQIQLLDDMLGGNDGTQNSKAYDDLAYFYTSNLLSYSSYLEDTVFCNDRSIYNYNGWDKNNPSEGYLYFGAYERLVLNNSPSLVCPNDSDKYSVTSAIGNGELEYPIGLLTADEYVFAGAKYNTENRSYYLFNGNSQQYGTGQWTMTPIYYSASGSTEFYMDVSGKMVGFLLGSTYGLRPVVSLSKNVKITGGDGTSNTPYTVTLGS